ncbi:PTS sugar transporter subunit IIA [Carnobacterium divergens]|uniref:PTS transporter subunit EIIC n=3 Tax=Carnobacterium divergens TaxID=2748 RepID=UPI000E72E09C|nr:PTS transporter subunit EIIC [Carnobacterium divergens]ANZ99047.1 PTS sugar transporter subunit IIA [Carnobacterium divergens]MDT1995960.1 PTS transporter subunit EIIC [Carnobacterium divergens]MDT2011995.1 PTS transporter subunit EIIC [Carnobacterium divergens]TFI67556.1 PTS sugar transporter subunit IIA [Carnobacterium divergens]TFI67677.1 PTS sugar transporter subunit IIA [Carnobacterium divergens]
MATDYKKIGEDILAVVGEGNILSITHCATRLRLEVKDRMLIEDQEIEKIDQVKGVFFNAGQYQIILGTGIVNKVYESIIQNNPVFQDKVTNLEEIKKEGNPIKRGIRTLADIFIPIIPGIVATGLFLGLKGVVLNDTVLGFFGTSADHIPAYMLTLMSVLTDTVFAFLPALICWSAFKKFGGTPIIGFVIGLMLVSPMLPNAYSVADINSGVNPIIAFGFIPIVGYQGSVLTALVIGILGAKLERILRKRMPDSLDLMFTPFVVIFVMMLTGLLILGPLLHFVENGLVYVVEGLIHVPFGIGGLIIGFLYPLAVMTGMHHLFIMIETTLLASTGFNPLITLCAMYGFANAAVCFAISTKAKNKNIKVIGTSAGITQLLGVSEPALFGITLRYGMKPLSVMLVCSAVGGALLSILGVQANSYGLAVILSPLMYIYDPYQLITYILVGVLTFAVAFVLTYLFAVPQELMISEER